MDSPTGLAAQNLKWPDIRRNMGYTLMIADRLNLAAMAPYGELASTGYCLANRAAEHAEYLVFIPGGGLLSQTIPTDGTLHGGMAKPTRRPPSTQWNGRQRS